MSDYFESGAALVRMALEEQIQHVSALARRRDDGLVAVAIGWGDGPERQADRMSWSRHWTHVARLDDEAAARNLSSVINVIRNNLFHGQKMYDGVADKALLRDVVPIMDALMRYLESVDVESINDDE